MGKLKRFIENIAAPFIGFAVLIDESRRTNEDGTWDKYWERRARKNERRNAKGKKRI